MQLRAMLTILSPAKDLDETPVKVKNTTQPVLLDRSVLLAAKLKTLSAKQIGKLMDISPKLAELNHQRYQHWAPPFTVKNAKPAAFLFNGEAYRGLDISSLDADDLRAAQRQVRILSGLYGVLRPLDLIQPYRLEMGTGLSMGRGMKDLYRFWGDRISMDLNEALDGSGSDVLINLASTEYFRSVDRRTFKGRIITPVFKDRAAGGYKVVMVFAKHQRGAMTRWVVQHRVLDPERLKEYDGDGYRFSRSLSSADEWVFTRDRKS